MVRFRALQEKSAARRRFRRRRDRREPPERPSPNPLDASLRAPTASRVPVSRPSPTAVDAATAGHDEGGTTLHALDNALLAAGIGNINLVKVSSILPAEVPVIDLPKIKPGAIVPTAYAAMTSETPGETVAAAVGYAVPDDPAKNGVIMEFHGVASRAEAEHQIHLMLDEAFRVRGEIIKEKRVVAIEHTTQRIGCALAAITLLADEDLV